MKQPGKNIANEKALLVQAVLGRTPHDIAEDSLRELERLADTAGAEIVGAITQHRDRPTAYSFIGKGKLEEVAMACRETGANLVIFDNELTPVQVNNIDLALGVMVIDRTELILQIFARRAVSAEAQVQVELAQLEYLVSRIPVSAKQQRFQGGIGMRGPGESPFQLRNAPMRRRIRDLKRKLESIQKRRQRTRARRHIPVVSLVGYTNAGKSTLMNALSHSEAYVDDRLFATLDTCTRKVHLPDGRDMLLSDTVGFIRHLPHGLVASFKSTLDQVNEADLLLVVADASHPHVIEHLDVVDETLEEIKAANILSMLIFNKCDHPDATEVREFLEGRYPDAIWISARKQQGLKELKAAIAERLPKYHNDSR